MRTDLEKQTHELEKKLTLMELNNYPNLLGRLMLNDCLDILVDYNENDFDRQMNRYLLLEVKYK